MPSLQSLLGKEDKFFDLLVASAEEARSAVQALIKMVRNAEAVQSLDEFVIARRNNKRITLEISEELCTNFVTVWEREDIEALSGVIYKIPKNVEKIAERIMLAPGHLKGVDLSRQGEMLEQAIATLVTMIKEVRKQADWELVKRRNEELQTIEGDADKVVLELLRTLYTGQEEAGRIIFLKDLFELFEKSIDRCRDAGNILSRIVLKGT